MRNISDKLSLKYLNLELIIYIIIWFGVFFIPFYNNRLFGKPLWDNIFENWIHISAYFILFFINLYLLIPQFLFPKKYSQYIFSVLLVTIAIVSLSVWMQVIFNAKNSLEMPKMELGPGLPPMEMGSSMPLPEGYRVAVQTVQKSVFLIFIDYFAIALLVLGASTTFKIGSRWLNEENRRKEIEKEHLVTELALLRHQINPHFLMNTLNNIHALIDINVDKARDAVIKLSVLMRYLLYDTSKGKTQLTKEIEFIKSYFDLMKLRYPKTVQIKCITPKKIPEVEIPPMLFISFIENAFKHGISYQLKSFVHFTIKIEGEFLFCNIVNSKTSDKTKFDKDYSGIGLSNVKKNLELLYPNAYNLKIDDTEDKFSVELTIPLKYNLQTIITH